VTDKIKLWPDRTLIMDRDGGAVRVRLDGPQPTPPNRFDVVLEHCPNPAGAKTVEELVRLEAVADEAGRRTQSSAFDRFKSASSSLA
jgi:hypothetical protein